MKKIKLRLYFNKELQKHASLNKPQERVCKKVHIFLKKRIQTVVSKGLLSAISLLDLSREGIVTFNQLLNGIIC